MAMPEVCQLWIEQRVEEELQGGGDREKSLREIGRVISDEIEQHFHVKVNPESIRKRAERKRGTNVPPQEVVKEVDALVGTGLSVHEATKVISEKYDKRHDSIRNTYSRERERQNCQPEDYAYNRACWVCETLNTIPEDDPGRIKAFSKVRNWIEKQIYRELELPRPEDQASEAWQFVEIAVNQMSRIRSNDPGKKEAITKMRQWLDKFEELQ